MSADIGLFGIAAMNLFTYGSLMFDEVWSRLVRGDYLQRPGRLHGFTRRQVCDDVYPVIFKSCES
ncbi:MAG: gamma-glutamylcyclotransferase, partial [Candidatus Krumholzibacteria bacterium]|nr:gamma-glutamylcyclotransferase [Candidatus Krumholzibacteria bacterium]